MSDKLRNEIKLKVASILRNKCEDLNYESPLITSGLLSSLKTVELASWIETTYGINFGKCGFSVYHFESIESIACLVEKQGVCA